ncbi:MAG TPA: protein kinase [Polyangiaceae bacterium]|nr:protein kinase [Polyangiaceae bacterium]
MHADAPKLPSRLGRYEVIAKLGKGGMAQVHLAVARGVGGFNKLVVLKRLDSEDPSFRRMFLDEARLAALLHHPNVVDTYEVSETDGSYFIAMEYLEGQPLDKLIRDCRKQERFLEPRLCARIVADALAGLHYTHELRDYSGAPLEVVHRDISPHNLLLTYEGTVKVLDFGVARTTAKTSQTDVGMLKGKLAYMAPEQAASQPLDRRADIFAMGAVFWELLTLQRLRHADSAAGVLNEAIAGQLPDLAKARPGLNRQLEIVLWRALAPSPIRRYSTAQDMRDALLAYLALDSCSTEELAAFMQQRFGQQRERVQRQVAECLRHAEGQDPVISITGEQDAAPLSVPSWSNSSRSLPRLDSGSLRLQPDDATTPLAPESMLPSSQPPPAKDTGSPAISRSSLLGDDDRRDGNHARWLFMTAFVACCAIVVFWWRTPSGQSVPVMAGRPPLTPHVPSVILRLHGSNTIGQELAPRLAEAFLKQRGYAAVERSAPGEQSSVTGRDPHDGKPGEIQILAHGSATAFTDLASGQCDVGMSSRHIKPEEAELLQRKGLGDLESAAGEHVLALDGIAVIVHPNSKLERVDLNALQRVFTGEVADFAAVGGARGAPHLYARDDRSGTFDTFKHLVLQDHPLAPTAQRFADSVELSGAVARDPQGIGFIGIPYIRGARALAVGAPGATALYPSSFTIATEGYELSRRLYLYLPVLGVTPLAQEFVSFALSSEGQAAVKASGFVDLTLRATATGPCLGCPARYAELSRSGRRLSLDFRFRKGSSDLDNRGLRDLDRLVAFLQEERQPRLVLVGFSDARGSTTQNVTLSLERAQRLSAELSDRGVRAVEVEAMGSALPVASNDSESGREKNRRVEVWLR